MKGDKYKTTDMFYGSFVVLEGETVHYTSKAHGFKGCLKTMFVVFNELLIHTVDGLRLVGKSPHPQ